MKLLVTGATGFIGSAFCRAAIQAGCTVAALARPRPHGGAVPLEPGVRPIIGSIESPPFEQIAAFQPEACLHAAWIATPGVYLESPVNLELQRWSADFLMRLAAAGTKRLVALGTCIEYAPGSELLSEESTPLNPASTYARCKHALHEALRKSLEGSGVTLAWARLFYPYGVGEHPDRLCSSILRELLAGRQVTLKTPRSAKDYIHVNDVASALLRVLESGFDGPINIGSGTAVTVGEIAAKLAEKVGRPEWIRHAAPTSPPDRTVADVRRLCGLGWHPRVSLDAGLDAMVKHFTSPPAA